MRWDIDALAPDDAGRAYLQEIDRRLREARWLVRGRVGGIQLSWVVVTIAGAAVSVAEVVSAYRWVSALLGFVIVAFQGLERIFGRNRESSRSLDVFRRDLGREKRMFATRQADYASTEDPFALFVERAEAIIARNDAEEIEVNANLTQMSG